MFNENVHYSIDGRIVPSKSPWSSPIVLIDKNDGSIRLCADYRKLNDITQSDGYYDPNNALLQMQGHTLMDEQLNWPPVNDQIHFSNDSSVHQMYR
jgi:hypothetical protein